MQCPPEKYTTGPHSRKHSEVPNFYIFFQREISEKNEEKKMHRHKFTFQMRRSHMSFQTYKCVECRT